MSGTEGKTGQYAMSLLIGICLWPPVVMLEGLVLTDLWAWFVVPLGFAPISKAHAIGLCLTMGLARFGIGDADLRAKASPGDPIIRRVAMAIVSLVAWGLGALIAGLM